MKDLKGKKILFFAPSFFGYENEIKKELENLHAIVDYFDDRPNNDFLTKVFIRLKFKFMIRKKILNYYKNIYRFINGKSYDFIFVISPETLSYKELETIKKIQPKAKCFLYMWDSFKNKNSLNTIDLFDKVYTFDSKDAEEYNLGFLPLFYIKKYEELENSDCMYDLTFIATAHSDRYSVAKKVKGQLEKLNTYFYFYLPSKIMFYFRKFFIKKYSYKNIQDFSFKPLAQNKIVDIFSKSRIILDINHPEQFGLTMRTLECLGAKKKLITTNKNIEEYDFFNKNNILIIDRNDIIIDKNFFTSHYENINKSIYEKYSLKNWIKTIFSEDIDY